MADFIGRSAQSLISNGGIAIPGTNLRQELVTEENVQRWNQEGRLWVSNNGTVDSPYTVLNAVTAIATPGWAIIVPAGKLLIPLEVVVNMITGTTAPTNITLVTAQNSIGAGTSTAGVDLNLNTAYGAGASGLSIFKTYTGAGTAAVAPLEFFRWSAALQAVGTVGGLLHMEWSYRNHLPPRVGQTGANSTFQINMGVGAAATAYITVTYALFNMGEE